MGNKIYVREFEYRNPDGDRLIRIKTYKSKPDRFNYVIWA